MTTRIDLLETLRTGLPQSDVPRRKVVVTVFAKEAIT